MISLNFLSWWLLQLLATTYHNLTIIVEIAMHRGLGTGSLSSLYVVSES